MKSKPSTQTTPSVLDISSSAKIVKAGLIREWLCDRRIVVYAFRDSTRATVDAWIEAFEADLDAWPKNLPFLGIHDLSSRFLTFSSYARQRATELTQMRPDVQGRVAIILPSTFIAHAIRQFLGQNPQTSRVRQVFPSRAEAIQWLLNPPEGETNSG